MNLKPIQLCIILLLLCLASCSNEEKKDAVNNPLIGTKWATSYVDDHFMVIEFTSEKQVQAYFAQGSSLTYYCGLTTGSYSISENKITFNNVDLVRITTQYVPLTGTFNGSIMQTQGKESIANNWRTWNKTWNKQ